MMHLVALTAVLAYAGQGAPGRQEARAAPNPATHDAAAIRLLADVAAAYRGLKSLDQESTYEQVTATPMSDVTRFSIQMQRPNRVLVRLWRQGANGQEPTETRIVCDGRRIWQWSEQPGYYTEEKAPRDLKGFRTRLMSLEMALLAEADPFPNMVRRAKAVKLVPRSDDDTADVEVVELDLSDDLAAATARISVGTQDRLIHGFRLHSRPRPKPIEREDGTVGPPEALPPTGMAYRSVVKANPKLAKQTFAWLPPRGAFRHEPYPTLGSMDAYLARNRKAAAREMPTTPTGQPTVTLEEYIRRARKRK